MIFKTKAGSGSEIYQAGKLTKVNREQEFQLLCWRWKLTTLQKYREKPKYTLKSLGVRAWPAPRHQTQWFLSVLRPCPTLLQSSASHARALYRPCRNLFTTEWVLLRLSQAHWGTEFCSIHTSDLLAFRKDIFIDEYKPGGRPGMVRKSKAHFCHILTSVLFAMSPAGCSLLLLFVTEPEDKEEKKQGAY